MLTNPTIHTAVARLRHADILDEAARAHRAARAAGTAGARACCGC